MKHFSLIFLMCFSLNLQAFDINSIQKYAESGAGKIAAITMTLAQYGQMAESLLSDIENELCGSVSYDANVIPQSGGLTFNSDGSYANCNGGYVGTYTTINGHVTNWMNVISTASTDNGSNICTTEYFPDTNSLVTAITSLNNNLENIIAMVGSKSDTSSGTVAGIDYNITQILDNFAANTNAASILSAAKAMTEASYSPAISAFTNSNGTGCYDNATATCKANPQYAGNQTVCLASNYKEYNPLVGNAVDGYCGAGTVGPCPAVPWCSCDVLTNTLTAMFNLFDKSEAFFNALMDFQPYAYIDIINTTLSKGLFTLSCPDIYTKFPAHCSAAEDTAYGAIKYPSSQCSYGYMTANSLVGGIDCSQPANINNPNCLNVVAGYIGYIQSQLNDIQTQVDVFNTQYFSTIHQRLKAVLLELKVLDSGISNILNNLNSLNSTCNEDINEALSKYNLVSGIVNGIMSVIITTGIMVVTAGLAVPFLPLVVGALTALPDISKYTTGLLSTFITNEIVPKPVTPIT